jgi:hypothetical protein
MKTKTYGTAMLVMAYMSLALICQGQFFPIGGYQGGAQGSGGDQTYDYLTHPRNLVAVGGDGEVMLSWDEPFPLGEVMYDDGSAEMWYWLNNPSTSNDYFYVRFESPMDGFLTDVAVLDAALPSAAWERILVCPDDGTGKPDLAMPWGIFPSVAVNSTPYVGGEWEILTLMIPHPVSRGETFYVLTQWPQGSTTGPYVGTDNATNSGHSSWSVDGGLTWSSWTENFIMRAYLDVSPPVKHSLIVKNTPPAGILPIKSIADGQVVLPQSDRIALSIRVPSITMAGDGIKGLTGYNIYRSATEGGPYSYVDTSPGLTYTDINLVNEYRYYYVVSAVYDEGESGYSNDAVAFPQGAYLLPYFNNFDVNDGGLYPTGEWEWGVPTYSLGPPAAYSPPNLWGTNLDGPYQNLSNSWLIRPFNLGSGSACKVTYAYWYSTQGTKDFAYFAVDQDYDNVYTILATYSGVSNGWHLATITIPAGLMSSYTRFAFIFQSDNATTRPGFYIDNLSVESFVEVDARAYFEGPYSGTAMTTSLNAMGLIPLSQPFNTNPSAEWYYTGSESVASIPNADVTDWILMELRETSGGASTATRQTMIAEQAGFMLKNGKVVGLDGSSNMSYPVVVTQNLYLVLWHRNHLGVMSSVPLVSSGNVYSYDFSTAASQAYGGSNGHKQIATGVWGMFSGDGNGDSQVSNADKIDVWKVQSGNSGYLAGDFNLSGQVDNVDKVDKWKPNSGAGSQVP